MKLMQVIVSLKTGKIKQFNDVVSIENEDNLVLVRSNGEIFTESFVEIKEVKINDISTPKQAING